MPQTYPCNVFSKFSDRLIYFSQRFKFQLLLGVLPYESEHPKQYTDEAAIISCVLSLFLLGFFALGGPASAKMTPANLTPKQSLMKYGPAGGSWMESPMACGVGGARGPPELTSKSRKAFFCRPELTIKRPELITNP